MRNNGSHLGAVFSMQSVPKLYDKDQLDKPFSQQSVGGQSWWLACSHYLMLTSDGRITTEDFIHAVVVVICGVQINETLIVICGNELQAFSKSNYEYLSKPISGH
jgi:hypothetical protein